MFRAFFWVLLCSFARIDDGYDGWATGSTACCGAVFQQSYYIVGLIEIS